MRKELGTAVCGLEGSKRQWGALWPHMMLEQPGSATHGDARPAVMPNNSRQGPAHLHNSTVWRKHHCTYRLVCLHNSRGDGNICQDMGVISCVHIL